MFIDWKRINLSKLKFAKNNNTDNFESIDEIMVYCEQYRKQLIHYCSQYFEYEYEYAKIAYRKHM
jgi:inorganic pyrophosphatase